MPEYTYQCENCESVFTVICSISNYKKHPKCDCGSKKTIRRYVDDCLTINGSVKKADSELKTIGDLANRNRDKLSDDEKVHLHNKHNSYKEQPIDKLPSGMKQIKKPKKKIKWT